MATVLKVENLHTHFNTFRGLVKAVDGVSFFVDEGEIIGLVGESGCGKSVSMLSAMQLIPSPPGHIAQGKVIFEDRDLLDFPPKGDEMRAIRGGKIAMIFQEPMTSLNPVLTISRQLTEVLESHLAMNSRDAVHRAIELLIQVGIPDARTRIDNYPHLFSGGMRQRIMIAMALACEPRLIIADEPTTALDVTTQAQLLELMMEVVEKADTALIIVTHNLGIVARYVRRIYVMYAGRIVESGPVDDIFEHPSHPYTLGLLNSVPRLGETRRKRKLVPIIGLPPDLIDMPPNCPFMPRCAYHMPECRTEPWPALRKVGDGHFSACFFLPEEWR